MASRHLRSLVARLHGCLASLSPAPARLLGLRAGLFGRPALSAAGTARALGVSAAHEGRLERRALVALRSAASTDCSATGSAVASVPATSATLATAFGASSASSGSSPPAPSLGSAGVPVTAAARTTHLSPAARGRGVTRGGGSGVPPVARSAPIATELVSTASGTSSWVLTVALAALAAAAAGFALLRAYGGPGQAAAPASSAAAVASAPAATAPAPATPDALAVSPPKPARVPAPPRPAPRLRRWGRQKAQLSTVAIATGPGCTTGQLGARTLRATALIRPGWTTAYWAPNPRRDRARRS
ncbi:MAG: hypothetical protein ABI355_03070 [Solirubrobacteraceae bacterium]